MAASDPIVYFAIGVVAATIAFTGPPKADPNEQANLLAQGKLKVVEYELGKFRLEECEFAKPVPIIIERISRHGEDTKDPDVYPPCTLASEETVQLVGQHEHPTTAESTRP